MKDFLKLKRSAKVIIKQSTDLISNQKPFWIKSLFILLWENAPEPTNSAQPNLDKEASEETEEEIKEAAVNALKPFADSVLTITGDNGVEFTEHEAISKSLNAQFYFAHPYPSWERGLNKNTNGLIRQYLCKGSDLSYVTDDDLNVIMSKLNNRPRKSLEYTTPNEIFLIG